MEDGGIKLTAFDDNGSRVNVYSADEPQPAQKDPAPGIERALGKTGGTPVDLAHQQMKPLPFLSTVMEGPVEKGVDITKGGAIYNFSGPQGDDPVSHGTSLVRQ